MMIMRIYESMAETIKASGVHTVFGLMGDGNLRFVTHLIDKLGMVYVAARHENAAVAMADGFARVSGGIGVCTVTQGPGLTNALTALTEAAKGGTPLLLVAGDTPTGARRHNQDIDQRAVVAALGIATARVRGPATAQADVHAALQRALVESRPVVLSVPTDVQELEVTTPYRPPAALRSVAATLPDPLTVTAAAKLIAASQRPLIVAGRGAVRAAACAELEALAARIGALLATTAPAKGLFEGNPFDLGIAGGFATPVGAELMGQADLVLAFGASLNDWTTRAGDLFATSAHVVHCDVDQAVIGKLTRADLPIIGDARATAAALLDELAGRGLARAGFRTDAVAQALARYSPHDEIERATVPDNAGLAGRADPRAIMLALDVLLPMSRTVAIDSGHFMGFPSTFLRVPDAAGWVFAQDFQSVGLGLGNAIGAALARPDRTAVLIIGDGGLMMALGELETAVRHRVPLLVVVLNDAAYGAEVHALQVLGLPHAHAHFRDADFAALATALGARAATVSGPAELGQIRSWLDQPDGPFLVDCKVDVTVRGDWLEEAFGSAGWLRRH
jgi:thiamine pyrophosphate-dependent acetolactate synthase large subunit-like protein